MKHHRSYLVRCYFSKAQEQLAIDTAGCSRKVKNTYIAEFNAPKDFVGPRHPQKIKDLKQIYSYLQDVPYNALEQAKMGWEQTKNQFFNSKTSKTKLGKPSFRKKGKHESFKMSYSGSTLSPRGLQLVKFGVVKTKGRLPPKEARFLSVTVKRNAIGQWFASILVEEDIKLLPSSTKTIGIDLGLTHFIIDSAGNKVDNPRFLRESQAKLKRAQQHLSRKKKGSKSYEKQRIKVASIHLRIANKRKHFQHCLSHMIVTKNGFIATEHLMFSNMLRNHKLAKSISDASWSSFINMLEYKSKWYGRTFHKIDSYFPSSKTCSICDAKVAKLPLDIREWTCGACGFTHDRDVNAAQNVLKQGLKDLYNLSSDEYADYMDGKNVSLSQCIIADTAIFDEVHNYNDKLQ